MDLEFQNIEENGIGKLFALTENDFFPIGQLFYNINHEDKIIDVDHIYIPRKYWSQNGIKEHLFGELKHLYPRYLISMNGLKRQSKLMKESPARSKAQFRYMQGICNGSIDPPEGMTRAQACEYVKGQKDYKDLPDKKSNKRKRNPKTFKPLIKDTLDIEEPTDVIRSDEELNFSDIDFAEKEKIRRIRERLRREKAEKKKEQKDPDFIYMPYSEGKGGPLRRQDMQLRRLDPRRKTFGPGNNPKIDRADHIAKWKVTKKYTHLNSEGKPCNCGFYKSDYKESAWKTVLASKLDKIIKDDPKVLRTDEGKKVLEWMKTLPEQIDDLLPWMVREYKKRRLTPAIVGDAVVGMERTVQEDADVDEIADGTLLLDGQTLSHWADWFNSNSPTRRGVDIMQLTTEQLQDKIKEWDEELADKMEEAVVYEGAGKVVYAYPDGWTMREVAPEECGDEGAQMGHCVGTYGYADAIRRGEIKILSLRDPENKPHATLEVKSNGHVEQIQGKQNVHPIGAYRRKIRMFIDDPQGFQNLFGKKAIQEESYPTRSWSQLGEDIGFYNLPENIHQENPPLVEEEFDPKWDVPHSSEHPAGTSSYSRGLRGTHYGILPGGTSIDYESILHNTDNSSPTLINKLYEIAKMRGEIPLLQIALDKIEERGINYPSIFGSKLLVIPNFEDQSHNGWRDVFEKETGVIDYTSFPEGPERDSAEKQYKELWKKWIQNIYSSNYETLLNNLVRINKYKGISEEQIVRSINQLLGNVNVINQLKNLIDKIETGDPFASLKPSFGFEHVPQESQLSLISKWKKKSMPRDPNTLHKHEIITNNWVKKKRYAALKYGFRRGYEHGWLHGLQVITKAIPSFEQTDDRKINQYQTSLPIEKPANEGVKQDARKYLNDVIGLVPSNFLSSGRKYTPEGKQFSKKKFIDILIEDFYKMFYLAHDVGQKEAIETGYEQAELLIGHKQGPLETEYRIKDRFNLGNILQTKRYKALENFNDLFKNELEKIDVETLAYAETKEDIKNKWLKKRPRAFEKLRQQENHWWDPWKKDPEKAIQKHVENITELEDIYPSLTEEYRKRVYPSKKEKNY